MQNIMVEFRIDDRRIGCGLRRFIVLRIGPKWATLFHVPTLATIQYPRKSFDSKAGPAIYNARNVSRILRRNVAQAKRLDREYSAANAAAALAALRSSY